MRCLAYWWGLIFVLGCSTSGTEEQANNSVSVVADAPAAESSFTLTKKKGFIELLVYPSVAGNSDTLRYALVQRGSQAIVPASYQRILVPVKKLVLTATPQIAYLSKLKAFNAVVGMSSPEYVSDTSFQQLVASGAVVKAGTDSELNSEILAQLQPELLVLGRWPEAQKRKQYEAFGAVILLVPEWAANHPLQRLEWLRVYGLLMGKKAQADRSVAEISAEYQKLAALAQQVEPITVMTSLSYQGSWYVPGRSSYTAQLIADAGGVLAWQEVEGAGSQQVSYEYIVQQGLQADAWINTGTASTLAEIAATDNRLTSLPPYQQQRVYNNNKRLNAAGWLVFFETAAVNPQLVLADLLHLFHPQLLPQHQLYYYQQLR